MPELNRRNLLAAAAVAGVAAVAPTSPALAGEASTGPGTLQGKPPTGRYRVDVHAHALPATYRKALIDAGLEDLDGVPAPEWSVPRALDFMERYGIQAQVLCVSSPGVAFLSGQRAVNLARATNHDLAQIVRARPARFGALAVLPLPDVDASVAEAVRALDTLKLDGISVLSNYGGTYLGSPALEPLWAELDKRCAYVYIHPQPPLEVDRPTSALPPYLLEFPFDTTRAVVNLIYARTFQRYPNIRWQVAHAGGTLPFLSYRASFLANGAPGALTQEQFRAVLRALRYDTALAGQRSAQVSVLEVTDVDHVLFGTDWPFSAALFPASGDPQPELSATYTKKQRLQIERRNALREFPRLAAAQGNA
jgi:6-methylsalicylate decarboxylase